MLENYMAENQERYDRQFAQVFACCAYCGGEISAGEEYTQWDSNILCGDDCILGWAKAALGVIILPIRSGSRRI